jgi:hypothetical protein
LGVMLLAHGGTGGLIAELTPVVLLLALGLAVWRRSRRDPESTARDETGVEQDGG